MANSTVIQALEDQSQYKKSSDDHIFFNPQTNKPWASDKAQRIRYWQPTLKALGLTKRRAYETRHTYATFLLTSGCNHAYAADQMGHSVAIFQRVYTK